MKKFFKKTSHKITAICFSVLLMLNIVIPIVGVSAAEYGSGDFELKVGIDTSELTNGNFVSATVNGNNWASENDSFFTENGENTITVTVTGEDGYEIGLRKGGDSAAVISEPEVTENTYVFNVTYSTENPHDFLSLYPYSNPVGGNQGGNQGGQEGPGNNPDITLNVDFGTASWVIGEDTVTAAIEGKTINNGAVSVSNADVIRLTGFNSETMQVKVSAQSGFNTLLIVNGEGETGLSCLQPEVNLPNEDLTFTVEAKDNNQGGNEEPGGGEFNTTGGPDDIEFDIEFTNTHMNVWINNIAVMSDANGDLQDSFEGTIDDSGVTDANETNVLKFQNVFGDLPVTVL